jgi:hypothetical protein
MIKLTQAEAKEKRHNPWYCKKCRKLVYIVLAGSAFPTMTAIAFWIRTKTLFIWNLIFGGWHETHSV